MSVGLARLKKPMVSLQGVLYRSNRMMVVLARGLLLLLKARKILGYWGVFRINHPFAQLHLLASPHRVVSVSAPSQALTCSSCPSCPTAANH